MESVEHQIVRQKLTIIKQLITEDKNGNKFILANREKIETLCSNIIY